MQTVPLTRRQKASLLSRLLPLVFTIAVFAGIATIGRSIAGSKMPLIAAFVALLILYDLVIAVRAMRDLLSGVAVVEHDTIEFTSAGRSYSAKLTRLGRMKLTPRAYTDAMPRERHRIVYSPRSRVVWEVARE